VYLDAAVSHFIVWDKQANAASFSVLTGIPPDANRSYAAYYAAIDPLLQLAVDHSPGAWLRCQEHLDENFVRRNEFYQDYLAPYGLRYLLGGKLVESDDCSALVTLLRRPGQGPFSDSDVACVRRIEGHLQRAARLHLAAGDLRAHAQMSASALNSLSYALWIVTAEGSLRHLNTRAEAILQANDDQTRPLARTERGACTPGANDQGRRSTEWRKPRRYPLHRKIERQTPVPGLCLRRCPKSPH